MCLDMRVRSQNNSLRSRGARADILLFETPFRARAPRRPARRVVRIALEGNLALNLEKIASEAARGLGLAAGGSGLWGALTGVLTTR